MLMLSAALELLTVQHLDGDIGRAELIPESETLGTLLSDAERIPSFLAAAGRPLDLGRRLRDPR